MDYKDILVKHLIRVKNSLIYSEHHYVYKIEDSVHYRALITNDYQDYKKVAEHQPEHSEIIFKHLQKNFDINKIGKIKLEWNRALKKYVVLDGCHRLAIMKHRNIKLKNHHYGLVN